MTTITDIDVVCRRSFPGTLLRFMHVRVISGQPSYQADQRGGKVTRRDEVVAARVPPVYGAIAAHTIEVAR